MNKKQQNWHIHTLCHDYYPYNFNMDIEPNLTKRDMGAIRKTVDLMVRAGFNICSVTDHDMLTPSLEAKKYAEEKYSGKLEMITGMECEVSIGGFYYIHILAHNITERPSYDRNTKIEDLCYQIRELGGTTTLAHPIVYPDFVQEYLLELHKEKNVFDFIEYNVYTYRNMNKDKQQQYDELLKRSGLPIQIGSDVHYTTDTENETEKFLEMYIDDYIY